VPPKKEGLSAVRRLHLARAKPESEFEHASGTDMETGINSAHNCRMKAWELLQHLLQDQWTSCE